MSKQKRPVYIVAKRLGKVAGEDAFTIIAIKQTSIAAETEKALHAGAEVVKMFLVS